MTHQDQLDWLQNAVAHHGLPADVGAGAVATWNALSAKLPSLPVPPSRFDADSVRFEFRDAKVEAIIVAHQTRWRLEWWGPTAQSERTEHGEVPWWVVERLESVAADKEKGRTIRSLEARVKELEDCLGQSFVLLERLGFEPGDDVGCQLD